METLIILLRWEGKYTLQWIIICHIFSQVATLSDIDLHFHTRPIPVIYLFFYFFFNLTPPPFPPHKKGQNHGVISCWKPHAIFLFLWNRIKFFKRESKPLTRRPVLGSDTVIADFAANKNFLCVNDNVLCFQTMASTSKTTKKSEKESWYEGQ